MHSLHQHLAVVPTLLEIFVLSLHDLFLEHHDHLINVARGDEFHSNVEGLLADVHVGAGEGTQYVHRNVLHDILVLVLELMKPIQDNQLDIVVTLGDQQLTIAVGCCTHCRWGLGQRNQRYCALIHHCCTRALQQGQDDLDVPALLCRVGATDLANEFQHCHLQDVTPVRYLLQVFRQIAHCPVLGMVGQHAESIAPCAKVLLAAQHLLNRFRRILQQQLSLCS
mmetsp:Transcript_7121/g.12250  ORF Transcript_7121/g.12250 Transcript_7121/m.12250 type:complete len:224 (-) Transcript_7121:614-1285(-)